MKRKLQGRYVEISTVGERAKAFVPDPLPPTPPITWTPALRQGFDAAMHALGRLDAASDLLPDTPLFLYTYIRKEAVLSSMIEGTQSSLSDLLVYELDEAPGVPLDDVQEVSNYVAALEHGMQLLRSGLPISLRLIREVHGVLLQKGRGAGITPGRFRRSQNWIGGTRPCNASFIPPPPQDVRACMSELESFMHGSPQSGQALLTAGLAHVQFETIHPFLDGNGRVGRLLVTLLLCERGVLREPLLYLSLYFKNHRAYCYELLNAVRMRGEWEDWLAFFAEAVKTAAVQAVDTAQQLHTLAEADRKSIAALGKAADSALAVHEAMKQQPIANANRLVQRTGLTHATVNLALSHLERLGVVREITGKQRGRIYAYTAYMDALNHGIEQPPG
ncbi:MAG: cell filamentation protein Fic [Ectothiorhodospiraceae bacterium]|nr:cell filamentation protein Fic [Ectothiorhodospiraceae bacterium]